MESVPALEQLVAADASHKYKLRHTHSRAVHAPEQHNETNSIYCNVKCVPALEWHVDAEAHTSMHVLRFDSCTFLHQT